MAKPKSAHGADDRSHMELEIQKKISARYLKERDELTEKLSRREAELKDRETSLAALRQESDQANKTMTAQLQAAQKELQSHKGEREAQEQQLTERSRELERQSQRLQDREGRLEQREATASALAAQCADWEKKLVELRLEHVRLQGESAHAQRTLAESQAELAAALSCMEERERQATERDRDQGERERRLADAAQHHTHKMKELALQEGRLQVREHQAANASEKAAEEVLRTEAARLAREARQEELRQLEQAAVLRERGLEAREAAAARAEERLREDQKTLAQDRGELDAQEATLQAERAALELTRAQWEADHAARLRRAEADERNARSGALAESQQRCADLESRAKELYEAHIKAAQDRARDLEAAARTKHDELIEQALKDDRDRRHAFERERGERESDCAQEAQRRLERASQEAGRIEEKAAARHAAAQERAAELEQLVQAARAKDQALDRTQQEVAELKGTLERRSKRLDEHIAAQASAQIEPLRAELCAREARIEKLQQMLANETQRRTELDALIAGSGGETVPRLKQQLNVASERVAALEQHLRELPRDEDVQRLRERADLAQAHEQAAAQLRLRVAQLETLRALSESEHVQYSGERAVAETLRATNQALRQELDHLKALVDQQVANPLRAFQEVYENVQRPTGQLVPPRSLEDLAQHLRHRMAALPEGRARYYTSKVVATFLGALSATRMLLLQGLSGTGKTSLPVAAAEALGASCEVIEVQSQWRDRGDLVGSYNPFHKRFYAQPFALALYRAGLPAFRERPFFIILDELNLSHVEHYFADVLSLVERDPREHRLRLVDDPEALARAPFTEGLVRDPRFGWSIEIPPNVWFIGTANRDESTRPISDKVYDRAVVMELNERADRFAAEPRFELLDPVGYQALRSMFDQAARPAAERVESVAAFLKEVVAELEQRFHITRTNRFEKQWECFLPVYLGSRRDEQRPGAGTAHTGEALDHFLATKLLRPLKERFDPNLEDMLLQLRDDLIPLHWQERQWGDFNGTQSFRLLDEQLRRRQSHGG